MSQIKLLHVLLTAIRSALQDTDILRQLAKLGYDAKTLREGEKLGNAFDELIQKQEEAQRGAKTATRNLQIARQGLQQTYMKHVSQARIIFQGQPEYLDELKLNGMRKKALDKWLKQCKDFYYHAPSHLEILGKYNISESEITEAQTLLAEIINLYTLQKQAQGRAQMLTQQKQEMTVLVERWYRKFIKVARIALEDQPQQLEMLGVVVKA
ncbi:hypothetical protein [Catalinimonas niigatensis]|uniref:hypothetical protein n=1 Tax=Catalinimonas niigatensis TaxID=1397264 RepID=UPI002665003A|nr:hypothetical protein [Catalinimonas niigatensis]WPP51481.1 hypothetical protein PZB72_03645 [Catalinimonas niigatensis]